jgi:glutathione S-transferase
MLTLYGCLRSRASRPDWLMREIGADYDRRDVIQAYRLPDPQAADAPLNTQSPAFLAINPQGLIPCMVDGDLVLTESLAITLHIARSRGGDLGPRDLHEEAQMTMWTLVGATGLEEPGLEIMFTHTRGEAGTEAGQAKISAARAKLQPVLRRIEAALSGDWLVGGRFTVADLNLAEALRYCTAEPGILDAYPATKAWLARCHARPAFQAMWAARLAEPA